MMEQTNCSGVMIGRGAWGESVDFRKIFKNRNGTGKAFRVCR